MGDLTLEAPGLRPVHLGFMVDIAQAVLSIVADALDGTRYGRPQVLQVGHATPPDDCCDYLNVVYSGLRPSGEASTLPPRGGERCVPVTYAVDLAVTVARGGSPTITGSRRRPIPAAQAETRSAEGLLEDAVALTYHALPALAVLIPQRTPFQWVGPVWYTAGRITPFAQGGCAGWVAQGALSLPQPPPAS